MKSEIKSGALAIVIMVGLAGTLNGGMIVCAGLVAWAVVKLAEGSVEGFYAIWAILAVAVELVMVPVTVGVCKLTWEAK